MSEFLQGALTGFVLGAGFSWWACRRGLRMTLDRLELKAVDQHGDLMSDTQIWEPGYREPADVQVARVAGVFCAGCKFENNRKCMAAPVNDSRGSIDQVTGLLRPQEYEICVIANKNYDCKKKVLK